jgi:HK97 gp10 family phage protein
MARQTFRIEGLRELEEALGELSKATGKNILKRVLTKAGEPIAEDAAANARRLTGKFERSFGVSQKLSRRQKSQHVKQSGVEVFAGPGALVQAITEEFGTSSQAPHPTLRPAWDANKKAALDGIKDDLAEEIEKARARAARKAAKQLALMNKN